MKRKKATEDFYRHKYDGEPILRKQQLSCREKRAFESERVAQVAADRATNNESGRRLTGEKPVSPYRCPCCKKWHLTSVPQTRSAA